MYVDFRFLAANLAFIFYYLTFEFLEFFRVVLKICGLRYLLLLGRLSRCCPDIYPNGTLIRGKCTYILTLEYPGNISLYLASNISFFKGKSLCLPGKSYHFVQVYLPLHISFVLMSGLRWASNL